jgi:Domain of unknown function (DUF4399)
MRSFITVALSLIAPFAASSFALAQERTPSAPGAEVYIISPKDGAIVHNPVLVQFGLKGMGVAPAGIKFDNTGHHHLLIDTDPPADQSAPLRRPRLPSVRASTRCNCCSRISTTSRTRRRCSRRRSPSP